METSREERTIPPAVDPWPVPDPGPWAEAIKLSPQGFAAIDLGDHFRYGIVECIHAHEGVVLVHLFHPVRRLKVVDVPTDELVEDTTSVVAIPLRERFWIEQKGEPCIRFGLCGVSHIYLRAGGGVPDDFPRGVHPLPRSAH